MNDNINESSQFYEYLKGKFGNCDVLPSGDYSVNYQGNYFYFSSDCTSKDVNLMSYYPGIGGVNADTVELRNDFALNGVPSNSVVMLAVNDRDVSNTFEVFDSISLDNGIDVSSVQSVCFSGSGDTGLIRMNEYLTKHSDLVNSSSIVVVDGYRIEGNVINGKKNIDILKNNNVPVYMVTDGHESFSNRVKGLATRLSNSGINTYLIETEENVGHTGVNKAVLLDGLAQYVCGVTNKIGDNAHYNFYKLNDNNFLKMDVGQIGKNNDFYVSLSNVDNFFDTSSYNVEDVLYDAKEKYSYLEDLGQYNYEGLSSSLISSDLKYIENFANGVISSIKEDSLFDSTMLNIDGGCGPLESIINESLSLYYDTVGCLLNKISLEVDAVVGIGQAFVDLDVHLENEVEKKVTSLSSNRVFDSTLIANKVLDKSVMTSNKGIENNSLGNVVVNSNNYKIDKMYENRNLNTVVSESSYNAVEEDNSGTNDFIVDDYDNKNINRLNNSNNDYNYNLSFNRNKNGIKNSEISYDKGEYDVIIETDGNSIVSMKYKYEYNTANEANGVYDFLLDKLNGNQDVEKVVLKDNSIEIIFKDSVFENANINVLLNKNLIGRLV